MVAETPARCVIFAIAGGDGSPEDVSQFIGIDSDRSGEAGRRATKSDEIAVLETYWELIEAGDTSSDTSELLMRMLNRIDGSKEKLRKLNENGWRLMLSVVAYVSSSDEVGSGFVFDPALLAALAYTGSGWKSTYMS